MKQGRLECRMKKWLGLKRQKLRLSREKDTNLKGLELEQVCSSARERGDSSCTVRIPAEHPGNQNQNEIMMQGGGNTIFTGERGLGVEGGRGVMLNSDYVIYERSQPSNVTSEHHPRHTHTGQTSMLCSNRGEMR